MKKRAVSSLLASLAVVSLILPAVATTSAEEEAETFVPVDAEAEPESAICLDGIPQFVEYEIRDGTTYVTVGSFVSMLDPQAMVEEENGVATVSSARVEQIVDAEGNTANVVQETLSMTVSIRIPYIVANSRYLYVKDNLIMLNGCVAAPIRMLAKIFNLNVAYDSESQSVQLTRGQTSGVYIQPGDSYYDEDTLYWLSRIINAESGNQILEGKIAVGNVVMNRVNSPLFPNTIYDVLYQKNQFSPVSSGTIKKSPNSNSVLAAKLVMDGAQVVPNALFFSRSGMSCYASKNRPYITTIGAHAFYA